VGAVQTSEALGGKGVGTGQVAPHNLYGDNHGELDVRLRAGNSKDAVRIVPANRLCWIRRFLNELIITPNRLGGQF
jgi:hypothetical protein